jgi:hypothetical protein
VKLKMNKLFICIIIPLFFLSRNLYSQKDNTKKKHKFGIGTSIFNLNESFDDLFFFNNSSPIYLSYTLKEKHRLETILNLSIISNKEAVKISSRGSVSITYDFLNLVSKKLVIYPGIKAGFNSNENILLNLHVGGEYFLHNRWSISSEVGLNYLIAHQDYLQTTSNIILRFYF